MENDKELLDELFNKEITKLRKEVYEAYESLLIQQFCPQDVENSWIYFIAQPLLNTINRKSFDILIECCNCAKQFREFKDK
jgi:hypothetical protein